MVGKGFEEFFFPIRSGGLSEAIVRRIGELIGSGALRAGDRLPTELELAKSFDVAPMTVRTALQALRDHALIETRRGRGAGTFVRDHVAAASYFLDADLPSVEEFTDFTIWREAVSGEACYRAAERFRDHHLDTEERTRMKDVADLTHRAGLGPDEYRFADAELHCYIAELSASRRLVEAEREIQATLTRSLRHMAQPPDNAKFTTQGHRALVEAITDGRPADARHSLREHVQSTLDMMVGLQYLRPEKPGSPT